MGKTYILYFLLFVLVSVRVCNFCKWNTNCTAKDLRKVQSGAVLKIVNFDIFNKIRQKSIFIAEKALFSPHSELALGMIIGIDNLDKLPIYSGILRNTGTIHVVVVSGYNINLVFGLIVKIIGSAYKKRNIFIACLMTLAYCLLSGFEPPVIRAWIMGLVIIFTKYYGTKANSLLVLIFAALIMLILKPEFLFSLSFQLSFLATFSLVYFSDTVKNFFNKFIKYNCQMLDDFYTSVAVQIVLWPFISYHFETFNILSPVINSMILWTVPVSTVFGGIFLILGFISENLGVFLLKLIFIPLDVFVVITEFFDKIPTTMHFKLPLAVLIFYYFLIFGKGIIRVFKK